MMNAFNLKDARAGDYIKKMVHLYPGVWSGFGEIHFKKQEFSEKIAGGPPSLYSPSIDAIFDVIGEMGAVAVVHCDHDTPYNLALLNDPAARAMVFKGSVPKPQYLEAFKAFLKRHPNVPIIWAHFMGNGRGVQPYPEHWKYLDEMLGDPGFKHVSIDMAWGLIVVPYFIDTPEHLKMTADLIRKYPDRFIYGSDQGATADWGLVKKSYDAWTPLWKEIGPELTRRVVKDNYIRIFFGEKLLWRTAMWMRSCAICKALMKKLRLSDFVRCQCGWEWQGHTNQKLAATPQAAYRNLMREGRAGCGKSNRILHTDQLPKKREMGLP